MTAHGAPRQKAFQNESQSLPLNGIDASVHPTTITFADNVHDSGQGKVLYVPPPWQRDRGQPIVEVNDALNSCGRSSSSILTMTGPTPVTERTKPSTLRQSTPALLGGGSRIRWLGQRPWSELHPRCSSSARPPAMAPSRRHSPSTSPFLSSWICLNYRLKLRSAVTRNSIT